MPETVTKVGGTLPSFAVSFVLYLVLSRVLLPAARAAGVAVANDRAG